MSRHISYYCPLHVVFNLKKPPLYHLLHLGEGYRGHFFGKVFTIATFIFFSFLLGMWVTKLKKFFKNIQLKKIASHFQDISCFKVKVQLYIGILSLSLSLSFVSRSLRNSQILCYLQTRYGTFFFGGGGERERVFPYEVELLP